jgi:amino acid adenylation domain-containing protein
MKRLLWDIGEDETWAGRDPGAAAPGRGAAQDVADAEVQGAEPPVVDRYPLTPLQEGMLFGTLASPGTGVDVVQVVCTLPERVDAERLREAWRRIASRHDVLRTAFRWADVPTPVQEVHGSAAVELDVVDHRGAAPGEAAAHLHAFLAADRGRGVDLSAAPAVRLALLTFGERDHRLVWTVHHALVELRSVVLVLDEVFACYDADAPEDSSRARPFREFVEWLAVQPEAPEAAFWRKALAGARAPTPLPGAPAASPGPEERTDAGYGERTLCIPPATTAALLAAVPGVRLNTLVPAAWAFVLGRASDEDDVVFGVVRGLHLMAFPGAEDIAGPLLNTIPLRVRLPDDLALGDWLRAVRGAVASLLGHEHASLAQIQGWAGLPGRTPLFHTLVNYQPAPLDALLRARGGRWARRPVQIHRRSAHPLALAAYGDDSLLLRVDFDRAVVSDETAGRMLERVARFLEAVAEAPGRRLSEVSLLSEAERRQVLVDWSAAAAPPPDDRCVHERFAEQAERTPRAVAVVCGEQRVTYAELGARTEQMARLLRGMGVGAEGRVALFLERGVELVLALLGVLRAGGCYVPIDPELPSERVAWLLRDSGAAVVLTQASLRARLPAAGARVLEVDGFQEGLDDGGPSDAAPAGVEVDPAQLAYVIYTSGSTGTPKGVGIPHRALARHMAWMQRVHPLAADDRVLQKTSVSFDASVWEFHAPLLAGATLVLAPPGVQRDPAALGRTAARERITILQVVPSLLGALLESGALEGCTSLRRLFCGGEALPAAMAARARAMLDAEVVNLYGPTEVCIDSVTHTCAGDGTGATVPIGRPVDHVRVRVLDRWGQPVPVDVPGELYLGGAQLARGYLGRPGLTAERFVPDPFSDERGARLYRTGDRVRWMSTGELAFLGRIDQQVKIRGFRIEPGEIEAALLSLPEVAEAVVDVREDAGDKRLVGYVVPADPDVAETRIEETLRDALLARLPEYMVPPVFVVLDALPLTPNGKVDRRALPAPEWSAGGERVAPRTPTEELLAGIWAEVLGREAVGVEEDFFALGGHSLLAMRVLLRVERSFAVDLPVRTLFEAPTVAALARRVEAARQGGEVRERVPLRPAERGSEAPLSFAQQRLWFVDQMEGAGAAYVVPRETRLRGRLDGEALRRALEEIVRRHEALRTVFRARDPEPVQVVLPPGPLSFPLHDLSALPGPEREDALRALVREEVRRPFDLVAGPLFRVMLARLGEEEHALLWSMHHIVGDGWSLDVFHRELGALYDAFSRGEPSPLEALPVQYADYALWQRAYLRGEVLNRQLAWWKAHLSGAPTLLELPTDRPRSSVRSWRGARQPFYLDDDLRRRLEAVARGEGATLFMVLLAAWQVLLGKYAGTGDVVVGSPIAGRTRAETEGLIGFFVNTLALRADLSGDPAFGELVGRVREATLGAYEHQDLPFAKLVEELEVERSLGHSPLVQVVFALHNGPAEGLRLAGLEAETVEVELETAKFDLTLSLEAQTAGLEGRIAYSTELFDASTIARLGEHYRTLLEGIAADPGRRLSELSLLDEAERRQILVDWNAAGAPLPAGRCVHELFEAQAARTPVSVAVVHGDERITYAELDGRANRLAHALRGRGVGPEARVGILLERGPELVVALLATLKAGGAYVPLDPAYPSERLRFMAADAGVELILTQGPFWTRHATDLAAQGTRVLLLDEARAAIERHPADAPPASGVGPEHLAHVIYTSGSTGAPKGTMVPHRSIPGYLGRYADLPSGTEERWLQYSALAWDALTLELWSPLLRGGCCVLYPAGEAGVSVERLGRAIREGQVTSLWMTAALFNLVVDTAPETLAPLRLLLVGGEQLSVPHVRRARETFPRLRLLNGYGPSECTVFSTIHPVASAGALADLSSLPIGRPVGDRRCYVLDPSLQPVPVGVGGELYVGGPAVARGYLGRPGLTAERFVPDPFSDERGARLYRTGDRVRWLATGELEFLGRIDQQVKIRGFRIEPGEVEAALLSLPAAAEAVVEVRQDAGEKRLVGYVVPVDADAAETRIKEALREALLSRLPEYMVPSAFVVLEALPLTPHGKVDRRALPAPEWSASGERVAPRTPTEELLAGIWAEVLGRETVGVEEDFFALGGHSLLAMRVLLRVERSFAVDVPVRTLFEAPTVAALARRIEAARQGGEIRERLPLLPAERGSEAALSFAQQRLWFVDQMEGAGTAYVIPREIRLRGRLDGEALRGALAEIVRRHEALRTVFRVRDPEPVQVVLPPGPLSFPLHDLSGLPAQEREDALRALVRDEVRRPFDLAVGPLFRATLARLDEGEHALLWSMHHIVGDGWSLDVFNRELGALYDAFARGEPSPLEALPVQYADYALWQRAYLTGEVLDRQLAWWKAQLSGAPALLELPTDRPRPAVQTYRGARQPFRLDDGLRRRLEAVARGEGATLFMVLLAAFQVLLSKYAAADDVVVGSPIAGRTRAETEGLIGFFVNTLALRADLSTAPDFRGLLAQVRGRTLGAYEHQDLPFEKLVEELGIERSLSQTPLVQAFFALHNGPAEGLRLAGLEAETVEVELETAKFDLTLSLEAQEAGLEGRIAYSTELFDAAMIARLGEHYRTLLEGIAADPGRRLSALSLLGEAERRQILIDWNAAGAALPIGRCVHELFEAQARLVPHAAAITWTGGALTYAELDGRANRLAHALRGRGMGPEARVGILLERGPELVVALLATLKAGGAYVPLDPAYPSDRLRFMAADAGVELILTQAPSWTRHAADLAAQSPRVLLLDEARAAIERHRADAPPASGVGPEHLAYVIYTSGSTGAPKGTMVPHRSIPGYLDRYADLPSGTPERWLQYSALAWDALTLELWSPLLRGGGCVIYPAGEAGMSVERLGRAIREGEVTSLWMTAALFNLVVDTAPETIAPLRLLLVGGEQLSVPHVRRARETFPELRLLNGYGPSECTVFSTIHPVASAAALADLSSLPIGRPVGDRRCYVLDPSLQPVPVGVGGELYVGGPAVARGYLGRPGLTAERFVPDPFSEERGARLYRTGDRVRWLATGELEFLGRIDQQVKIRGFRIEPGEVEAALLSLPAVAEAVVEVRADASEKRLVGYVVPADVDVAETRIKEALRDALLTRLPEYMVPSAFVVLQALPLTPHGKVDRRALPAPEWSAGAERVAPRTPTEELLAGIWAEVLGREAVGVEEDFFTLGGHSLLATRMQLRVERSFGVELPLRTIFERPTVAALAEEIDTRRARASGPETVPLVRASRQAYRADLSTL